MSKSLSRLLVLTAKRLMDQLAQLSPTRLINLAYMLGPRPGNALRPLQPGTHQTAAIYRVGRRYHWLYNRGLKQW